MGKTGSAQEDGYVLPAQLNHGFSHMYCIFLKQTQVWDFPFNWLGLGCTLRIFILKYPDFVLFIVLLIGCILH